MEGANNVDSDPFIGLDGFAVDSTQSTITSTATTSAILNQSCETLITDDELHSAKIIDVQSDTPVVTDPVTRTVVICDSLQDKPNLAATELPLTAVESPDKRSLSHISSSKIGDLDVLSTGLLEMPPSLVVAPDGGWGWMIVLVSFLCASVVDGLCAAFGVMLPSLVTHFEQSSSRTSFAGSLFAGGFLMFGMWVVTLIRSKERMFGM